LQKIGIRKKELNPLNGLLLSILYGESYENSMVEKMMQDFHLNLCFNCYYPKLVEEYSAISLQEQLKAT
jgi:hypothetical protein